MKKSYLKTVIFFISLLVPVFFANAQRSNGLAVEGKISVEEGSVEGAVIQMYKDGRRLDNYGVGASGNYKLELNYGHKFELIFSREGNFPQKIVVDTNLPRETAQTNPSYPPFPVNVNLFTEIEGIDRSFSENTILKIYYSSQVGNFISDLYYNDAQVKKLIDQAILQSQMIDKEADYLSRLTRAELAQLRKEYDQLLKEADEEYGKEKFLDALDGYKAANQVFPKEQYPKDRIAEINDLLGLMMVAEEMDKALADRFNTLIANADQFFDDQKYFEAGNSYNRALSIRPGDNHANQRVKEIDEIFKAQQIEQQYQDLIVRGNNALNEKLYNEALQIYTEASGLRPGETYPQQKVEEIGTLLAQLSAAQKAYEEAVAEGDKNFETEAFSKAKAAYDVAKSAKPGEAYPVEMVAKIDSIVEARARLAAAAEKARLAAIEAQKDSSYNAAVAKADGLFGQKEYESARESYRAALELKPGETYPQQKVEEIGTLLAQLSAAQKAYEEAVAEGDKNFETEAFSKAKSAYNVAKSARPGEAYPVEMVAKIDSIVEARARLAAEAAAAEKARLAAIEAQKDSAYNAAVAKADGLFGQKEYESARESYRAALEVKPGETYPQQKVEEIGTLLAQLSAAQKAYEEAVAEGDKNFETEAFSKAKAAYDVAKSARPGEAYPGEMVAKIDSIVETRARLAAEAAAAEKARLAAIEAQKDSAYNAAVAKADGLFGQKEYESARESYRAALEVRPGETYPQQKVEEIGALLAQLSAAQKAYEEAVAEGDKNFGEEAFAKAKSAYNVAKSAKPGEAYPVEMVAKIDSIVEARARLAAESAAAEKARLAAIEAQKDSAYNAAVAKADGLFGQKEYESARESYRAALEVKPGETYPQQKVEEIGTLLAQLSAAQKAYEEAVAEGDKNFETEAFSKAKAAYNVAKSARPGEAYPGEMVAKIDSIVEARARLAAESAAAEKARLAAIEAQKDSAYNAAVAKADGLFGQKEYESARESYRAALEVKPGETYPQQKVEEIGTLLAQLSAAQKAYEEAVAEGDKNFGEEAFSKAKAAYNVAKSARPGEAYPVEMVAKIDSIVETRARLAAEAAAAEKARLAAIEAQKDSSYNAAVAKADGLFGQKEYESARESYRAALEVKPGETYPQQKVEEIGTLLAQLAAAQKAYEEAIAEGDKNFETEAFSKAKAAYDVAKSAKPGEAYPGEMVAKIDSIVGTRARLAAEAAAAEKARLAAIEAQKDSSYNAAVAKADGLFGQKEYESARESYRAALEVKPGETYPQQKVEEIGALLAQLSAAQKAYEEAVAEGDRNFGEEAFSKAKAAYNVAKSAKPGEAYPVEMVAKIDSIVGTRARLAAEAAAAEKARLAAIEAQKDSSYNAAVAKADGLFGQKEYESARESYRAALEVKPGETYPQQKVEEIGTLLAQLSAAQKAYEEAVAEGDRNFGEEAFSKAKSAYDVAKSARPGEAYPGEMVAKIDSIVETRARLAAEAAAAEKARLAAIEAQKDSAYNAAVAKADGLFGQKEYESSRASYRAALEVRPGETYPQQKVEEIGTLLAQLAAAQKEQDILNTNYNNAIKAADNFFKSEGYPQAKEGYQKALGYKPQEEYPLQKITEIDKILAQQKTDEEYRNIILAADGYFNTKSYPAAKSEYEKALNVKPEEQYPKSQIGKIEDILKREQERVLAEQQAAADLERRKEEIQKMQDEADKKDITNDAGLDALYNGYIQSADAYFDQKDYNTSRGWYYKALDVKPEESYPKGKIAEINNLVGNLLSSQKDKDYQGFIDLADSTFRNNQLAVARGWYNRALSVKPNEAYPKNQLKEIQKSIDERLANKSGELFNSNVKKAAEAFEAKNYSVARFWYKKALGLQPDDQDVKKRLLEIEEALHK